MIVCDTGPLVAAALANDDHHHACVEVFTGLHLARRPLLVPATVVAEVGYLLGQEAGPKVESLFLGSLAAGDFTLVDLTIADYARMANLCGVTAIFRSALPTRPSSPSPNGSTSQRSPPWTAATSVSSAHATPLR